MGENSAIAWTDHTFNGWVGCTKVSPGCANCYAEAYDKRVGGGKNRDGVKRLRWGPGAERVRTSAVYWKQPLKWNREAAEVMAATLQGVRPRVFCSSLADVFDPAARDMWRLELFDLIRRTPSLDWMLLTKRPEQFAPLRTAAIDAFTRTPDVEMATVDWLQAWVDGSAPSNVWLGVTVENQAEAERRIPLLLAQDAAMRFLSCEPLLEGLDLSQWLGGECRHEAAYVEPDTNATVCRECDEAAFVDLVIVGGESGPKARPFDVAWARSLRDQCRAAGTAYFCKQLGARPVDTYARVEGPRSDRRTSPAVTRPIRLLDRAGADPSEWPTDLRVREWPEAR